MSTFKWILIFISLMTLLIRCGNDSLSYHNYIKWMSDHNNNLIQKGIKKGISMRVSFLPNDYLIYNETENEHHVVTSLKDSIRNIYKNSMTFMLTISPEISQGKSNDIMYKDINNFLEFSKRADQMNFDMAQYITLKTDHHTYSPVLTTMENTYGMSNKRNIIIVFSVTDSIAQDLYSSKQWDVIYEDELFNLGTNHFVFDPEDIKNIPELVY